MQDLLSMLEITITRTMTCGYWEVLVIKSLLYAVEVSHN